MTAISNNNAAAVELLLVHGAKASTDNLNEMSPLMKGVLRKNPTIVKLLLSYGAEANIDTPTSGRITPLGFATEMEDVEMVRTLLEEGADPDYSPDFSAFSCSP